MEHNYARTITQMNQDMQSARWFDAFREGDEQAFSRLYDMHSGMLYNYGCRLTSDMELLKDCIQDVFIKIYNKRTELDTVQNFKSYIIISLKNKLCDEARKRVHVSGMSVEEYDAVAPEHVEKDYLKEEDTRLNLNKVSRLMSYLSPRQRKAIELYYIEERKYEDICDIMQMNYQSVRNLIHRGMTKLRSCACL